MKKLLSVILALAMVLALGVTAFAEDLATGEISGSTSTDVKANYSAAGKPTFSDTKVYYVIVAWAQSGTLQYSAGSTTYKWDAVNNKYVEDTENATSAGWTVIDAEVKVTVTNQSNAAVTASVSAASKDGFGVTGSFDETSAELGSAAPKNPSVENLEGTATTAEMVYTITAVEGEITADDTTIATLTITLTHE